MTGLRRLLIVCITVLLVLFAAVYAVAVGPGVPALVVILVTAAVAIWAVGMYRGLGKSD